MSKPLVLTKIGSKWTVHLDMAAAKRFGARGKRMSMYPPDAVLAVVKEGGKLDLVVGGEASRFTKKVAEGLAHQIGHYMLGLGDFVYAYVEERKSERDPRPEIHVPRGSSAGRDFGAFSSEVKALLFARGFGQYPIEQVMLPNCEIITRAWRQGKAPCSVADFFADKLRGRRDPGGRKKLEDRNKDTGQYTHSLDRICARCGHRKGEHEAHPPYAQYDDTFGFECEGFRAKPRKKGPR